MRAQGCGHTPVTANSGSNLNYVSYCILGPDQGELEGGRNWLQQKFKIQGIHNSISKKEGTERVMYPCLPVHKPIGRGKDHRKGKKWLPKYV